VIDSLGLGIRTENYHLESGDESLSKIKQKPLLLRKETPFDKAPLWLPKNQLHKAEPAP
jgi:hypothetical protein